LFWLCGRRIRIHIKIKSRIRIRIKVMSWIRTPHQLDTAFRIPGDWNLFLRIRVFGPIKRKKFLYYCGICIFLPVRYILQRFPVCSSG
jgi:hypothetical protein